MTALFSPAVIGIAVGIIVARSSEWRVPVRPTNTLAFVVLGLLGAKSGLAVAKDPAGLRQVVVICAIVATISAIIARGAFGRIAQLGPADSGALGVHYASVSVATFPILTNYLERAGFQISSRISATFVVLEILGILAGLTIAAIGGAGVGGWGRALRDMLVGRSIVALTVGFAAMSLLGPEVPAEVTSTVRVAFASLLPVYMVTVGIMLGSRLHELRLITARLFGTVILVSICTAAIAAVVAQIASWSIPETAALMVMAASASYVAAPGIVARAIPDASPAIYVTCAVMVTFPLNVVIGIPGFVAIARGIG